MDPGPRTPGCARRTDDNAVMLAFSGGGTWAAALSYGVLKELRDTPVPSSTGTGRLFDEIHSISSVSGGSFTAAYYGLHGDRIFDDYEKVFLRQNVQGALIHGLLNPLGWFSRSGRAYGDGHQILREDGVRGRDLRGHVGSRSADDCHRRRSSNPFGVMSTSLARSSPSLPFGERPVVAANDPKL